MSYIKQRPCFLLFILSHELLNPWGGHPGHQMTAVSNHCSGSWSRTNCPDLYTVFQPISNLSITDDVCLSSIYNLTLPFCQISCPTFPVWPWPLLLAWIFLLCCFIFLWVMHFAQPPVGGAPAWVSGDWKQDPSAASLFASSAPKEQLYPLAKAIIWCGGKGIKPARQKLPPQPTWDSSQGSLVLLLKITLFLESVSSYPTLLAFPIETIVSNMITENSRFLKMLTTVL